MEVAVMMEGRSFRRISRASVAELVVKLRERPLVVPWSARMRESADSERRQRV